MSEDGRVGDHDDPRILKDGISPKRAHSPPARQSIPEPPEWVPSARVSPTGLEGRGVGLSVVHQVPGERVDPFGDDFESLDGILSLELVEPVADLAGPVLLFGDGVEEGLVQFVACHGQSAAGL